jgi:dihydrofolate reductase
MLSIIVAVAKNHAIGKDNQLLWHISEDLKRFKRITESHKIIMGRNTLLSLPKWPLPKRTSIVITDNPEESFEGCITVNSIHDAVAHCNAGEECFVIGGASVYRQLMPLADKLYITRVNKDFDADTFFPEVDENIWQLIEKSDDFAVADGSFTYRFETYIRR